MTNEQFSKLIRRLRGDQSLRAFAAKCGISHTTIDNLEKGVDFRTGKPTQIKLSTLSRIFEACNIPEHFAFLAISGDYEGLYELLEAAADGQLFGSSGEDGLLRRYGPVKTPHNARPVKRKRLPILGNVACGEPIFANEERDSFVDTAEDIDADFCLTAKGDSMINARIFDGDILFVKSQQTVDNGEIAVILIDDEATVKRVYYDKEANTITLMPENPTHKVMRYSGSELNNIHIIGKVIVGQYRVE